MPRKKREILGNVGSPLISVPGCLFCWEPLILQQKVSPNSWETNRELFRRICSILKVDSSTISSSWNFGIEAFPFCGNCTKGIQQLIHLEDKLESIRKEIEVGVQEVKNKLLASGHKVISTDQRILGFRGQVLGGQGQAVFSSQSIGNDTPSAPVHPDPGFHQFTLTHQGSEQSYATVRYPTTYSFGLPISNSNSAGTIISDFVQLHHQNNPNTFVHQNYHPTIYNRVEDQRSLIGFGNENLVEVAVGYTEEVESGFAPNEHDDQNDDSNDAGQEPSSEDYIQSISKALSLSDSQQRKLSVNRKPRNRGHVSRNSDGHSQSKQVRSVEQFPPVITNSDGRMFYENIEIMKNENGSFYCGKCEYNKLKGNTSVTLTRMKIHCNGVHLDAYRCKECNNKYSSREHLLLHEKKTHNIGVKLTPCPVCGMPVADFGDWMNVHIWKHKSAQEREEARALGQEPTVIFNSRKKRERKHKCPHCGKQFYKKTPMERHAATHLRPTSLLKNNLASPDFKTVYENIEISRSEDKLICGRCGYKSRNCSLQRLSQMKRHIIRKHTGLLTCVICKKKFENDKTLKDHQIMHTTVPCPICGKPYAYSVSNGPMFKEHLWLHKNEDEKAEARALGLEPPKRTPPKKETKKFECDICGKKYPRPDRVTQHKKRHLPPELQKDLQCPSCELKFVSNYGLVQHFRIHHDPSIQWMVCPIPNCGKRFRSKKLLDRHVNSKLTHIVPKLNLSCNVCKRKFKIPSHLTLHEKSHSEEQLQNAMTATVRRKSARKSKGVKYCVSSDSDESDEWVPTPHKKKQKFYSDVPNRCKRSKPFEPPTQPQPQKSENAEEESGVSLSLNSLPNSLLNGNTIRIISDELISYVTADGKIKLLPLEQTDDVGQWDSSDSDDSDFEIDDYMDTQSGVEDFVDSESEVEYKLFPDPDSVDLVDPLSFVAIETESVPLKEESSHNSIATK